MHISPPPAWAARDQGGGAGRLPQPPKPQRPHCLTDVTMDVTITHSFVGSKDKPTDEGTR